MVSFFNPLGYVPGVPEYGISAVFKYTGIGAIVIPG